MPSLIWCAGSKDGGRTVTNADPELSRKMELAAKKLNLKGHMAGLQNVQNGQRKFLYACCDIEGKESLLLCATITRNQPRARCEETGNLKGHRSQRT